MLSPNAQQLSASLDSWPSLARQTELAKLVEDREPLLKYTFGFIDEKKNFKADETLD